MPERYLLLTFNRPIEGKDGPEYQAWYRDTHVPAMLEVDGFLSGQRFAVIDGPVGAAPPPHRYLTAYELETSDLDELFRRAGERAASSLSPDHDLAASTIWVFAAISGKQHPVQDPGTPTAAET